MSFPAPLADVESLAIILPSWIGDTVMATPALRAVRAARPRARIIGLMRRGLDEILRGTPWLDEMMVCNMRGAIGPLRLGRAIRRAGARAVLLLPNSFKSALAARLSGAAVRVGYARDGRGWLLSHSPPLPTTTSPIPMVDYYAALAKFALGVPAVDPAIELSATQEERAAADELLEGVDRPLVLLNPGATRADKRWPAERFAAVADSLAALRPVAIAVTGSPGERAVLDGVVRAARVRIIDLAERGLTLGSLKAVVARAALLITNDTGPRHIAAALGTPVVTLFGPTDHRWTTLQNARERLIIAEPFLPEHLVADRHAQACAIDKISVGDVLAAAESLLSRSGA